jgi:hypothetical protein
MDSDGSSSSEEECSPAPEVVRRHEQNTESNSPSFTPWVSIIANESQDMESDGSDSDESQEEEQRMADL